MPAHYAAAGEEIEAQVLWMVHPRPIQGQRRLRLRLPTGAGASELTSKTKRKHLKEALVEDLKAKSDVKVVEVIFTDVAVQ